MIIFESKVGRESEALVLWRSLVMMIQVGTISPSPFCMYITDTTTTLK